MAMAGRISCSNLVAALVVLAVVFASSAHALVVVNEQKCNVTVFVPPICQPCHCPMIACIRAPCIQNCDCPRLPCQPGKECAHPECICSRLCRLLPGVVVEAGATAALPVEAETFPLAFLNVEFKGRQYVVKASDLKSIYQNSTVYVTRSSCGKKKQGIVALVQNNPEIALKKRICLRRGQRYGS
jgi:hypothetical protein